MRDIGVHVRGGESSPILDPTGAGDIFAAALMFKLAAGMTARDACAFACCVAAQSVTRPRLEGLPTAADLAICD